MVEDASRHNFPNNNLQFTTLIQRYLQSRQKEYSHESVSIAGNAEGSSSRPTTAGVPWKSYVIHKRKREGDNSSRGGKLDQQKSKGQTSIDTHVHWRKITIHS